MSQTVLGLFWRAKLAEREAALRLAWAALRLDADAQTKNTARSAIADLLPDLQNSKE
jgi:hypothetical protein